MEDLDEDGRFCPSFEDGEQKYPFYSASRRRSIAKLCGGKLAASDAAAFISRSLCYDST